MSKSAANLARNTATQDQNNATSLEGTLTPLYTRMAAGQATPGSIAENTAAQQSLGGGQSAAMGELGLQAARTRNAGGFAPAADESARRAGRQMSQDAAGITAQNAKEGLAGLQGLYGTNSSQALNALGLYNNASNSTFWNQLGGSAANALGKGIGALAFGG